MPGVDAPRSRPRPPSSPLRLARYHFKFVDYEHDANIRDTGKILTALGDIVKTAGVTASTQPLTDNIASLLGFMVRVPHLSSPRLSRLFSFPP